MCEINYQGDQDAANDVVPMIGMFPLRIYLTTFQLLSSRKFLIPIIQKFGK